MADRVILTPREARVMGMRRNAATSPQIFVFVTYEELTGEKVAVGEIGQLLSQIRLPDLLPFLAAMNHALTPIMTTEPAYQGEMYPLDKSG